MTATLSWVVGRGGLLGRHVEASLAGEGRAELWHPQSYVHWEKLEFALADLEHEATAFLGQAARSGRPWRLLWCAGAGVVATAPETLAQETTLLTRFLAGIAATLTDHPPLAEAGSLFFASSAGGVYSASSALPPFDEFSPVGALAPYGREKLVQEQLFTGLAETWGIDLLIGRLSNLYGPGQKLSKPQGLISHVGWAALRRQPVSIYVSLDTIRDYLYAADAGYMIGEALKHRDQARREGIPGAINTKIFASEIETTVASVLGAWRQALRRPLRVALAANPAGRLQPRVLSFRSRVGPDVRGRTTLLPLGLDAVRRDQLARLRASGVG